MNSKPGTSKQNSFFEDDEIFEDSAVLANFNNSSFKDTSARLNGSNVNTSDLNISALCCDEEISGYDKLTGQTWIYPTNYPVRDYQFNIINAALLKNTLVSLPTGLGKTFIAAVVMYNFYRWYPLGKIVFMAPTRPLVAQQIDACYNVVAIPHSDTVELTGHKNVNERKTYWQSKRVIFATPQVIYNDIKSGICPADKIRCIVVDEAHRARGNYAYCQILAALNDLGLKTFRVLALSATPGSKVEDVINVVKSLHIAHLELRSEGCIDVAPYSHAKKINTVVVPLGPQLTYLRQQYVEIVDSYARSLKDMNILPNNIGNLSKGRVVMMYKEFQNKDRANRHPRHNHIMKDFTILIALFHGLELLNKHGSRVFLNFFDEHPEKSWIQADDKLMMLLERLRDDLGVNPLGLNTSVLPDGTIPELPKNLCFGHPKFYKLKEIMTDHFKRAKEKGQDTKAIVFCEYRESVNLVHCLLLQCRPLIVPQMFVGQGASGKDGKPVISQKQQLRVMRSFREGSCNTLVATCVAEEGLDVGSVDLILCFDISTRSPIRLVQRCGRTGRERGGQVFILVTEGREHQTLQDCMRQRDGLNNKILNSREVNQSLYAHNPRMMPRDVTPKCQKMYITVKTDSADKGKKPQKDLRTMLLSRVSSGSSTSSRELDQIITEDDFKLMYPGQFDVPTYFDEGKELWSKSKETIKNLPAKDQKTTLNLSTWLEWQRTLQKTVNVDHSKDSEILAALLQYSDAKRFELPASTQNPCFETQNVISSPAKLTPTLRPDTPIKNINNTPPVKTKPKKKQKAPIIKSPNKKDGDIRALFSTATKSTKNYTKLITDLGIQDNGTIPTRLIGLLVDLTLGNNITKKCNICEYICDCKLLKLKKSTKKSKKPIYFLKEAKFPDIDLIDDLDVNAVLELGKDENIKEEVNKNVSANFELEFDFDSPINLTSPDIDIKEDTDEKNFDLGDIDDIFADSSPEEGKSKVEEIKDEVKDKNSSDPKEALGFFGLDSIDDIFADSDDELNVNKSCRTQVNNNEVIKDFKSESNSDKKLQKVDNTKKETNDSNKRLGSPSILSGKVKEIPTSPILCSQVKKFKLSRNKTQVHTSTPTSSVKRCLIPNDFNDISINVNTPKDNTKSTFQNNITDTTNKSMFTITQLVEMINKTQEKSMITNTSKQKDTDIEIVDDRSTSPILLTQAERKRTINNNNLNIPEALLRAPPKKVESLIILESDSDSDDNTQVYDVDEKINDVNDSLKLISSPENRDSTNIVVNTLLVSPEQKNDNKIDLNTSIDKSLDSEQSQIRNTGKRKLEDEDEEKITNSPFFNKRPKLNNNTSKPLSLQEKVLAALTSNKVIDKPFDTDNHVNYVLSPRLSPTKNTQKENRNPEIDVSNCDEKEYVRKSNLEMLQMFRRGSKVDSPKIKFESILNSPRKNTESKKRKLDFDDSDDDFVSSKNTQPNLKQRKQDSKATTNHKVRKKKQPKPSEFLDLSAELSGASDSGDELTDDSEGSIAEFLSDAPVDHEDMQAHYMRSVKSPVNGVFKIPQLPSKYNNEEIFSQYVEEDAYEMDSFCVDSHIELTQANDLSELEVAEMILEQRKGKKKIKTKPYPIEDNDETVIVRKTSKNVKRRIESDSDDSM